MTLAAWIDQAERSAARTRRLPMVFHKRRGKSTADAYVTMPAWVMVKILKLMDFVPPTRDFKVDL